MPVDGWSIISLARIQFKIFFEFLNNILGFKEKPLAFFGGFLFIFYRKKWSPFQHHPFEF